MKVVEKQCSWCGTTYTPHSGRQQRCDPCRATPPAQIGRCRDCGSLVSGRHRWGRSWGGECDRAETRVDAYLDRLGEPR